MIYTTMKDKIIKLYKDKLFYIFEQWKLGTIARQKTKTKKKMMMTQMESDSL